MSLTDTTVRELTDDDAEARVLAELQPVVAAQLDRHLGVAKEWFPHEYVPWSLGRDFDGPLNGTAWTHDQSTLSEAARVSLFVNLLTEDNLPSYQSEFMRVFGQDSAWGTWIRRWTAEEARHGAAMRDYLMVTRAVDPVELERARMVHMSTGFVSDHDERGLHALAYVSFQELATRVSHRNTGAASGDPVCEALMTRIATDENLHMIFYRSVLAAALDIDPDLTMRAITDVVQAFQMPGHSIAGFNRKSVLIANAGIYDVRQHRDQVIAPVLRSWGVWERTDLGAEGEAARDELAAFMDALETASVRFEERRDARLARTAATS